jgi:Predicted metal-dependent hydrolase with the TIM-barrel fold
MGLADITRETPNPPGGLIVRDETIEPSGILKDEALSMFYKDAHLWKVF